MKDVNLIIMIIIFISELILEFIALPILGEDRGEYDHDGSNFGAGLAAVFFLYVIIPPLTLLSLIILCCSCHNSCPATKIVIFIILCIIRGLIMITFFNEDIQTVKIFGIVLEILNFIFMFTSISYQIKIKDKYF